MKEKSRPRNHPSRLWFHRTYWHGEGERRSRTPSWTWSFPISICFAARSTLASKFWCGNNVEGVLCRSLGLCLVLRCVPRALQGEKDLQDARTFVAKPGWGIAGWTSTSNGGCMGVCHAHSCSVLSSLLWQCNIAGLLALGSSFLGGWFAIDYPEGWSISWGALTWRHKPSESWARRLRKSLGRAFSVSQLNHLRIPSCEKNLFTRVQKMLKRTVPWR